jgi:hypothetical protein
MSVSGSPAYKTCGVLASQKAAVTVQSVPIGQLARLAKYVDFASISKPVHRVADNVTKQQGVRIRIPDRSLYKTKPGRNAFKRGIPADYFV